MSTPAEPEPGAPNREDIKQRAVDGVVAFVMRGMVLRVMGVASTVVLARILDPSDLGVIAIGQSILSIGFLFTNGGLASGLIQQSATPTLRQLQTAIGFQLALCVPLLLVLASLATQFGRTWQIAAVMSVGIPLACLRVPVVIVAQRDLDYLPIVKNQVIEAFIGRVLVIVLVIGGLGVWGVAVSAVAAPLIGSTLLIARLKPGWIRPRVDRAELRGMLRFGAQFQAIQLYNVAHQAGANFIIGAVGGIAVLGVWNIVTRLIQVVAVVLTALYSITFAATARMLDAGVKAERLLSRGLGLTSVAIGIVCVGLGAPAAAYVPALLGSRWADAGDAFTVFTITLMVNAPISTCLIGYLIAIDRTSQVLRCVVPSGVISLGLTAVLVPSLGVMGAVLPTLVWTVVECVLLVRTARQTVTFPAYRILVPPFIASAILIGAGWVAVQELGSSVIVAIGVGLVSEIGFLLYAYTFRRSDTVHLMQRVGQGLPGPAARAVRRLTPAAATA